MVLPVSKKIDLTNKGLIASLLLSKATRKGYSVLTILQGQHLEERIILCRGMNGIHLVGIQRQILSFFAAQ